MKTINLDAEEQELLDAFEAGEFKSIMTPERKQFVETVAKQSVQQNKRVNIKVSKNNFNYHLKVVLQRLNF